MIRASLCGILMALFGLGTGQASGEILYFYGDASSSTSSGSDFQYDEQDGPFSLPYSNSILTSAANVAYNIDDANGLSTLDWRFDLSRGEMGSAGVYFFLEFSVDIPTPYHLSGSLTHNGAPFILQDVLLKADAGPFGFRATNYSNSTSPTDTAFEIGTLFSSPQSFLYGSNSGILDPGGYYLEFYYMIGTGPTIYDGFPFTPGQSASQCRWQSSLCAGRSNRTLGRS